MRRRPDRRGRRGLAGDRRAASAIEAVIVLPTFLMMLFFVFNVNFQLFTQAALDGATRLAARQIRIGANRATTDSAMRTQICNIVSKVISCTAMQIYVTSGATFSSLVPATLSGTSLTRTGFSPGVSDSYVLVQVANPTAFLLPLSGLTPTVFVSNIAFRNEP